MKTKHSIYLVILSILLPACIFSLFIGTYNTINSESAYTMSSNLTWVLHGVAYPPTNDAEPLPGEVYDYINPSRFIEYHANETVLFNTTITIACNDSVDHDEIQRLNKLGYPFDAKGILEGLLSYDQIYNFPASEKFGYEINWSLSNDPLFALPSHGFGHVYFGVSDRIELSEHAMPKRGEITYASRIEYFMSNEMFSEALFDVCIELYPKAKPRVINSESNRLLRNGYSLSVNDGVWKAYLTGSQLKNFPVSKKTGYIIYWNTK